MRLTPFALLLAGCSSAQGSASSGGGAIEAMPAPSAGSVSETAAPSIAACPSAEPAAGEACDDATNVFACEYGRSAVPDCDRVYDCTRSSTAQPPSWQAQSTHDTVCGVCPDSVPEEGGACSSMGALCTYYEGTCGCMQDADAGAPTWRCTRPDPGCPARRPRSGAACVHQMRCDYGTCLFSVPLTWACSTRADFVTAWEQTAAGACP